MILSSSSVASRNLNQTLHITSVLDASRLFAYRPCPLSFSSLTCAVARCSVSAVFIVMSVGLSVDYSMHLMHFFLMAEGQSRNERAYQSLSKMGIPVLMSALTTLVGVLPLAFGSSVIYRTCFAMLFGVASFASAVGIVVVPLILSIVGPPPILAVSRSL